MSVTHTGYFRPADSHKVVGVSRSTIYRWKQSGLISSRKIGGMGFSTVAGVKSIIDKEGGNLEGIWQPSQTNPIKTII